MNGNIFVGTVDFDHDDWSGDFFDPDLPGEWRFQHYTNQLAKDTKNMVKNLSGSSSGYESQSEQVRP